MNLLEPKSKLKVEEPFLTQEKKELYEDIPQIWDPTGRINLEKIKKNTFELEAKYIKYNTWM